MSDHTQMTLEEKIMLLKRQYAVAHPDARRRIAEWEQQLYSLELQSAWLRHPTTQMLRSIAEDQIEAINSRLSGESDMDEFERHALFKAKEMHLVYLAILSEDVTAAMQSLNQQVETEL